MPARAVACLRAFWRFCRAFVLERRHRDPVWALALLAAASAAHFVWLHVPAQAKGRVFAASQALLICFLLLMASRRYGWPVKVVAVLASAWNLLTAGCYLAHLWRPFAGECTGRFDYPLAMAALTALVGLAWLIYRGGQDGRSHRGSL